MGRVLWPVQPGRAQAGQPLGIVEASWRGGHRAWPPRTHPRQHGRVAREGRCQRLQQRLAAGFAHVAQPGAVLLVGVQEAQCQRHVPGRRHPALLDDLVVHLPAHELTPPPALRQRAAQGVAGQAGQHLGFVAEPHRWASSAHGHARGGPSVLGAVQGGAQRRRRQRRRGGEGERRVPCGVSRLLHCAPRSLHLPHQHDGVSGQAVVLGLGGVQPLGQRVLQARSQCRGLRARRCRHADPVDARACGAHAASHPGSTAKIRAGRAWAALPSTPGIRTPKPLPIAGLEAPQYRKTSAHRDRTPRCQLAHPAPRTVA